MNITRTIFVLALAGLGYQYWSEHRGADEPDALAASASVNGFVPLPPMDGAGRKPVVIFAPANCPEEGGRRADSLADHLSREGIPYSRSQHASFTLENADADVAQRIKAVMNGELPIVLVRGKGKANPSLAEVMAEYEAAGAR